MPTAVDLRLDEAVDLGHAWVQSLSDSCGARVLFLKGPALHRHGLREKRQSSDVDVLVDPAAFDTLCAAFLEAGWVEREVDFITTRTSVHSRTFLRDDWPCDVDVHAYYPGFLADPRVTFDALWAGRVRMQFAHQPCDVPGRLPSVLILALHSLRGKVLEARHERELEQLLSIELSLDEREELAQLARATGSAATLESVLPRLGVHVTVTPEERASPEAVRWRQRIEGSYGAYYWIDAYRRSDRRDRALVMWRAVWPTREHLLLSRPDVTDTVPGRLKGRVERWGRGIRSLPRAIRAIRRHR